jgi:hypothetical protein
MKKVILVSWNVGSNTRSHHSTRPLKRGPITSLQLLAGADRRRSDRHWQGRRHLHSTVTYLGATPRRLRPPASNTCRDFGWNGMVLSAAAVQHSSYTVPSSSTASRSTTIQVPLHLQCLTTDTHILFYSAFLFFSVESQTDHRTQLFNYRYPCFVRLRPQTIRQETSGKSQLCRSQIFFLNIQNTGELSHNTCFQNPLTAC